MADEHWINISKIGSDYEHEIDMYSKKERYRPINLGIYQVDWVNGSPPGKADIFTTPHYCKHCTRTFLIRIPKTYTGDALIKCGGCGWLHPRQISAGTAVSCDPPIGKYITIEEVKS